MKETAQIATQNVSATSSTTITQYNNVVIVGLN